MAEDVKKRDAEEQIDDDESVTEDSFKGLCVNCANRHICILSKRPGGVWHCEEYQ
ncbi:hypothetical protein KAH37_03640 [bacterium]|nr:hypothetical protein [bacterium]